jgi:hypothetical protein
MLSDSLVEHLISNVHSQGINSFSNRFPSHLLVNRRPDPPCPHYHYYPEAPVGCLAEERSGISRSIQVAMDLSQSNESYQSMT